MARLLNGRAIELGTCYYPEHWDESLWEEDLGRMLKAGLKTIRIAEFAWSLTEPEEGKYTFEFFDRFLDLCEKTGMKVIFCTPTATPPAWLTTKYPEVLNRDSNGVTIHHGERQQTNYNSPVYRAFSRKITEVLAEHYAKRPCIIGWQLDNEFNCGNKFYHSDADIAAFREFLKKRYVTLDALNRAWGAVFWNQTYTSWEEVSVPLHTNSDAFNPHQLLDFRRFVADSTAVFALEQAEIIRKYRKPDDFIMTNGIFGNTDYDRMLRESIDYLFYDSYPDFAFCLDAYRADDFLKDRKWSRNLTTVRSHSGRFGIMEQQSGACGAYCSMEAPSPRPGQLTLWTMQSIAHGADFVGYFRWRTCTFGNEMYWHGILDYSGRENRRYREVCEVNRMTKLLREAAGSVNRAEIGILKDFDNDLDMEIDRWHGRIESASEKGILNALEKKHVPFDFVRIDDDTALNKLTPYRVLLYPHPEILTEKRVKLLESYAKRGGTLILGARTGQKDISMICTMEKLPGLAAPLTGADVLEYTFTAPDDGKITAAFSEGTVETAVFNELLEAKGKNAEVIARYENGTFKGEGALVRNRFGKGTVYYYGAAFSESAADAFLKMLSLEEPYGDVVSLPEGVELCVRKKKNRKYLFILNYQKTEQQIEVKRALRSLFSKETAEGVITLPPYGSVVCVLEEN